MTPSVDTDGNLSAWTFATRAVHAGRVRLGSVSLPGEIGAPAYIPTAPPIHPSVTYLYGSAAEQDAVFGNEVPGYVYTRHGSPTLEALEGAVASLERGEAAVSFASGMAAIHAALLALDLSPGDRVVASRDLYGATLTLLETAIQTLGVQVDYVDCTDVAATAEVLAKPAVAVLCETVSNPLLKVADVPALAVLAARAGAKLLVDSTFSTPWLVQPLAMGADVVIHSATKYLGGHGDAMGGIVAMETSEWGRKYEVALRERRRVMGTMPGPFEAWLLLRGLQTLDVRMARHCANALEVAHWLDGRASTGGDIAAVMYPGLAAHPQHDLARRLAGERGYGGVVSFELATSDQATVFQFMDALRLCLPGTTLGDVYSQVLYPARASHRRQTPEERRALGISDGLLRLSAGIEAAADIIGDIEQALDSLHV